MLDVKEIKALLALFSNEINSNIPKELIINAGPNQPDNVWIVNLIVTKSLEIALVKSGTCTSEEMERYCSLIADEWGG